jgi:hypothetical protein
MFGKKKIIDEIAIQQLNSKQLELENKIKEFEQKLSILDNKD